jgi:uncharacterized protein (DUF302 family)
MSYYINKTVNGTSFDSVVDRVVAALKLEGFGVLTEIDVKATLQQKIGVDFRPYRILGACNPQLAHQALTAEDKVGVMLPCNVIVQDLGSGRVEVAAINPQAAMETIGNAALTTIAAEVAAKLTRVIGTLEWPPSGRIVRPLCPAHCREVLDQFLGKRGQGHERRTSSISDVTTGSHDDRLQSAEQRCPGSVASD